jgi:aminoglycoside 6-adenylyltransferase
MTAIECRRAEMLASILEWATATDNVRALVQTGSLARHDGLADELSDLDIEIVARDPALLIESDAWIHKIGSPVTILHLDAEDGQEWSTRLVIFDAGIKVDFMLVGLPRLEDMSGSNRLAPPYERGYRVLLDKDGLAKRLPPPSVGFSKRPLPAEERFRERVEEFWFEAFHVPRYLARGEHFLVKQRDWTMKVLLLEMMEWHALARSGGSVDVWHMGKGLRTWTDDATWAELQETFGRFDAEDARRAYDATTRLYSRLARELAGIQGWAYPDRVEAGISALDPAR